MSSSVLAGAVDERLHHAGLCRQQYKTVHVCNRTACYTIGAVTQQLSMCFRGLKSKPGTFLCLAPSLLPQQLCSKHCCTQQLLSLGWHDHGGMPPASTNNVTLIHHCNVLPLFFKPPASFGNTQACLSLSGQALLNCKPLEAVLCLGCSCFSRWPAPPWGPQCVT